jgi:Glyoxalase-like domain
VVSVMLATTLDALELDHVLIAVADLAAAAREIEARHGLASIEGGRHHGWGTANRIVPLGESYLELVSVVDAAEAAQSSFGSWVARVRSRPARLLGWAVRTHELDAVARRLDLRSPPAHERRAAVTCCGGGWPVLSRLQPRPALPFFIEWAQGTPFPGRASTRHPAGGVEIARLQLDGDANRLAAWLGAHDLPIAVRAGAPVLASIVLTGPAGDIILDADPL